MIADLPAGARGTPRQVNDMLGAALAARDLDDRARAETIADLAERVELRAAEAHPHDECRNLVKHLGAEAPALFTFLAHPDVDATKWRASKRSDPPSSTAECGAVTAPGAALRPRAG